MSNYNVMDFRYNEDRILRFVDGYDELLDAFEHELLVVRMARRSCLHVGDAEQASHWKSCEYELGKVRDVLYQWGKDRYEEIPLDERMDCYEDELPC